MVVVAATQNKHKIQEIYDMTKEFGIEVISRDDAGVPDFQVEEDGATFEANSEKKAREIMAACGKITIADDSGLMVDALDGAPGVISARFAGEDADDEKNNEKLLRLMAQVPPEKRGAKFVSVITMIFPNGEKIVARGECKGHILYEPKGTGGFGYDPLFTPEGEHRSFGEMSAEEKNRISHRARALESLRTQLRQRNL